MTLTALDQAQVSDAPLTGDIPKLAAQILRMREREQERLHRIDRYMRGHHDSVYVPQGAKGEYEWLRRRSVVNFLPLIVGVVSQNLHVDGYRPSATADITDDFSVTIADAHAAMEADDVDGARQILARGAFKNAASQLKPADDQGPWSAFMANRLASKQHGLHDAVATFGIAYTVVLPGKPQPVIRPVSPRILTALYADDIDDEWPIYAVEERVLNSPMGPRRIVRLYDDQNVYTLTGKADSSDLDWPLLEDPILGSVPAVSEHGLGVCPVVRFLHKLDLDGDQRVTGVAEPLIPLQDQLNTTTFNLLMAQQYGAFRQRWVTGMVPDDEDGRPREPFRSGVDRLMVAESTDTKFGEFGQSALGDFLSSIDATIRNMSTISQLPPYQLLGTVANLPLALDTPVLTPLGRRMMGELKQGDEVFAPSGSTVSVRALSPVFYDHECYRMRFDDGTEVVADAQHRWETTHFADAANPYGNVRNLACPECGWESAATKAPARGVARHRWYAHGIKADKRPSGGVRETSAVTTAEIAESVRTAMGTFNHFIPVAKPWDGPEQDFLIDPYVLGVFLGDGDHIHGAITAHSDDAEETAANMRACGEIVDVRPYADGSDRRIICVRHDWGRCPFGHERPRGTRKDSARCRRCANNRGLISPADLPRVNATFQWRMEALGLRHYPARGIHGGKHIPEEYFQGSFKQRLALLQGLMDTDGSVNRKQGSLTITLHHERLVKDLHRLICSLGHKAVLRERGWTSKQLGTSGTCWRIAWSSPDPAFRLGRKLALQRTDFGGGDGRSSSPFRRYITACEPVESVPVRCITVDSDDHQFCVTDSLIPTCNSADALAAAKDGQDRMIDEFKGVLTEPWKQTLQLSARAAGDVAGSQDASAVVVWRDTGARAFAATVDGLGKLTQMLGVPATELWSKVPGATAEDVERWKATAKSGDALAMLDQMLERQLTKGAQPPAAAGPDGQPPGGMNPNPDEPWQADVLKATGV